MKNINFLLAVLLIATAVSMHASAQTLDPNMAEFGGYRQTYTKNPQVLIEYRDKLAKAIEILLKK